jgi:hypothetical protein
MITMERTKVTAEQFKAYTAPLSPAEHRTAASYWATFVNEWDQLSSVAFMAGQGDVVEFLDDMADTAADFWTDLSGDLGV